MTCKLTIYTDGCSKGNPGPAGIGVLILKEGSPAKWISRNIGTATNNQAEYNALITALKYALEEGADEVEVRSDSELMVNQMNGRYRVKNPGLEPLHKEARRLAASIKKFSISYIPRELNGVADRLASARMKSG